MIAVRDGKARQQTGRLLWSLYPGFHTEGGGGGGGGFIPLMILARGGYPPHQTAEQCFF